MVRNRVVVVVVVLFIYGFFCKNVVLPRCLRLLGVLRDSVRHVAMFVVSLRTLWRCLGLFMVCVHAYNHVNTWNK